MKKGRRRFQFFIQVPGSSANLGPGFDVLAIAVKLYLQIKVQPSPRSSHLLHFSGEGSNQLAGGKSNLILEVARHVSRAQKIHIPPLYLDVKNEIPLARGLGSSAAAITAGVAIAECFSPSPFTVEEFFKYALAFESHPDNLAASLLGGLTAVGLLPERKLGVLPLPLDRRLKIVAAIPDFEVSTQKARRVLPLRYVNHDVIANLQNAILLSHALQHLPFFPIRSFFEDHLHQPYREALVPGLHEALHLSPMPGLVGTYLSGSGSTVAALAQSNFQSIGHALQNCFSKHALSSKMVVLTIDRKGRSIRRLA
jgi:homoserine kinase